MGPAQGPRVVLVQRGSGSAQAACSQHFRHAHAFAQLSKGDVFFLPCDTLLQARAAADAEGLLLWVASVNSSVFDEAPAQELSTTGNGHAAHGAPLEKAAVAVTA